jgi:hypothetical protein
MDNQRLEADRLDSRLLKASPSEEQGLFRVAAQKREKTSSLAESPSQRRNDPCQ